VSDFDRIEEHRDLTAGLEYEDWSERTQLHRHHRKLRSQRGTDEPENIMLVTPEQHDWIHRNVGESYELGWLVHSWEDPAEVPIRGEWTSDGPRELAA